MTEPCWRLILNGKCAGSEPLREAVMAMRGRVIALDVRVTWEGGDAERYVAEAINDGVGTLIAAGGDGTLSEVAATLANRAQQGMDALPTLGLVPLGTANDFASAALVPVEVLQAFELIRAQPARPVDLLKLDTGDRIHWAANLASGGFGTQVTVETSDGLKKLLGGLAYMITGLSKLGRIEPTHARIHGTGFDGTDFDWQGNFIALGIGNSRQAGGGQALCPDAVIDDGLLDVTVIPELTGEVGATLTTLLADGKHAALDQVATRAQLPWVEIDADDPLVLNLDGEPLQSQHFRIECAAGHVRMHLPDDCPLLSIS